VCFLFLAPLNEVGPSISSSVGLSFFVPLVYVFVLYKLKKKKKTDFLLIRHEQMFFYMTEVESVNYAVRTESLYKTDKIRL
jgi:hypothetical protein